MAGADVREYLTPAEAGAVLGVLPLTVRRWEAAGKIEGTRTPGGHRRYRAGNVEALRRQRESARTATLAGGHALGALVSGNPGRAREFTAGCGDDALRVLAEAAAALSVMCAGVLAERREGGPS